MTDLNEKLSLQWKDAINLLMGLWLIVSPWALGYAAVQYAATNAWVVGMIIAVAAAAALIAFQRWEEWVKVALGAWLIVSPFVLDFAGNTAATWNQIIVGAIVGVLALWAATASDDRMIAKS